MEVGEERLYTYLKINTNEQLFWSLNLTIRACVSRPRTYGHLSKLELRAIHLWLYLLVIHLSPRYSVTLASVLCALCSHGPFDRFIRSNINVGRMRVLLRDHELCASGGGRPGLPVPNGPYELCARKATPNLNMFSCSLPLHFWQNDRDLLSATAVTYNAACWQVIQLNTFMRVSPRLRPIKWRLFSSLKLCWQSRWLTVVTHQTNY